MATAEEARVKAEEKKAKAARQAELDRRNAVKKAVTRPTLPPLVTSS